MSEHHLQLLIVGISTQYVLSLIVRSVKFMANRCLCGMDATGYRHTVSGSYIGRQERSARARSHYFLHTLNQFPRVLLRRAPCACRVNAHIQIRVLVHTSTIIYLGMRTTCTINEAKLYCDNVIHETSRALFSGSWTRR